MSENLMTRAEVADLLHLSLRSIDRLRSQGLLPATKVLTTVRIKREDVVAFLEAQRQGGRP